MILYRRWSPFIKAFRKQSVLTAAIKGKQTSLVRRLSAYQYVQGKEQAGLMDLDLLPDLIPINNIFNKDEDGQNPLHYAYLYDLPDIRQILRQSGMANVATEDLLEAQMNVA